MIALLHDKQYSTEALSNVPDNRINTLLWLSTLALYALRHSSQYCRPPQPRPHDHELAALRQQRVRNLDGSVKVAVKKVTGRAAEITPSDFPYLLFAIAYDFWAVRTGLRLEVCP